jgi:hypothetical protein
MSGLTANDLPVQDRPNAAGLPLTDHDLMGVAERDHPALAAQGAHLSDVIHIDDRVAVNPAELVFLQASFDHLQRLRGQKPLFGCDDGDDDAFGLKRQNFIGIQQIIFISVPATTLRLIAEFGKAAAVILATSLAISSGFFRSFWARSKAFLSRASLTGFSR